MASKSIMEENEVNLPIGLSSGDVSRYSRQMLVSDIGASGQSKISKSKVIIVGAGGLGSAVIATLAGAGVGTIGVIDPDVVDSSNLHRQTIHREVDSGHNINKAMSAKRYINQLNSSINVITFCEVLDHTNVIDIITEFDVVVDASDNPRTRYMLNDACILSNKPLISGSAVGLEGQLTVYNYSEEQQFGEVLEEEKKKGPCYRCIYPNPPKTSASCSDNGVVGMVPAVIGNLQGLETLKVIVGFGEVLSGTLVMYDARTCSFHRFKLKRRDTCATCGIRPTIMNMEDSLSVTRHLRGIQGCTSEVIKEDDKLISHCSVYEYHKIRHETSHVLLDVREKVQYEMCHLSKSINLPLSELESQSTDVTSEQIQTMTGNNDGSTPIYVLCRRGISSVKAVEVLVRTLDLKHGAVSTTVCNIDGGLAAWSNEIDPNFPLY